LSIVVCHQEEVVRLVKDGRDSGRETCGLRRLYAMMLHYLPKEREKSRDVRSGGLSI